MAAPSAPTAPRFSPVERPRAAIATDGTLAAIIESQRVVVLELPGGEPFAEVGVDPAASANEVAWVGAPPRLLVLSRYTEHTRVHLVDPHGPRALADLRLESPMRLAATCGAHALVVSPQSALVITAADNLLVSVPYPARAVPAHAGTAGTNFLVAHADSVEEWDPHARMPKRRLKLPRAATITALGGSDRCVWMTTQQEPSRLDVLALVDRGQPKAHDLPEPITFATGHPRSDLVVCLGESGKMYIVDLDGRSKLKTLAADGIEKIQTAGLVVGRLVGVLAAAADCPVAILPLEGQTADPDAAPARPTPPPASSGPVSSGVPSSATTGGSSGASSSGASASGAASKMTGATPAVGDAPAERKKPPPPPPRSGNTMPPPMGTRPPGSSSVPPPMAGSSHASGPVVPPAMSGSAHATGAPVPSKSTTSSGSGLSSVIPSTTSAPSSTSPSPSNTTPASTTSSGASPSSASNGGLSLPPPAPGSSSLARPATRAFARAPTPHPRAPSEGVEVDLEGVFDELSAEAQAYNDRAPSPASSEQFDSPLAFEARPVAEHPEPTPEPKSESKPNAKPAESKSESTAKPAESKSESKPESKPESRLEAKSDAKSPIPKLTDPRPVPTAADRPKAKAEAKAEAKPEAPDAKPATSDTSDKAEATSEPAEAQTPSSAQPADDDDEDLAPPTLTRDEPPTLVRDDAKRAPVRESQLSLRDAPVRKAPRPITLRQGPALPAPKTAWRDEVVFWTYEVFDGVVQRGAPIASPMDDLAERFDVPDAILPALVVLYGAHLAGERGVAPVHVARVLGSWDEALGRGLLAMRGLATFVESRVRLAGPIQRFLDEVPVETGAMVGVPGEIALPGPHAVIAKAETPLKVVAVRWVGAVGGAILAAHDDADLAELFVEARARGAAPMFRIGADELLELGTDPAILVVTDEEVAESLGVPRLG